MLCFLGIMGILYLQFGQAATVRHSETYSNPHGYEANLTITANKICIFNRKKLTEQLIRRTIDNDFKNMQFSYDMLGYPNQLNITVYTNIITQYLGIPAFTVQYTQEIPYQYNVKDHPEMFFLSFQ